jgi:hypothetical protein
MQNKTLLFGVIAIVVIGGIAILATKNNSKPLGNVGVYCSPDGTLSGTKPIQSHRSYCLKTDSSGKTYAVNAQNEYSFSIVDDQGNTLKDFAITHTKSMHVIVVRKDLANFQHVHPEYDQTTGTFTLKDLTFPADGQYRIFADFAPEGGIKDPMGMSLAVTISEDISVGSNYTPQPLGSEEKTKTFDEYRVSLATHSALMSGAESMLMFSISQNGKPITDLEEYLGALGHSVIIRESTLDFIHAHPIGVQNQNGTVSFMVNFPEAGKYKVFAQFQRAGKVFTTDFVVSVAQNEQIPDMSMPGMDHSMP